MDCSPGSHQQSLLPYNRFRSSPEFTAVSGKDLPIYCFLCEVFVDPIIKPQLWETTSPSGYGYVSAVFAAPHQGAVKNHHCNNIQRPEEHLHIAEIDRCRVGSKPKRKEEIWEL
jgi:hypothetical protein